MTIERVASFFTGFNIECDVCGKIQYLDFDHDEFQKAVDSAKSLGWKIRKVGDEWKHICPDCKEK
jgi:Fe2+ or Zn2+ uptake regulation protein